LDIPRDWRHQDRRGASTSRPAWYLNGQFTTDRAELPLAPGRPGSLPATSDPVGEGETPPRSESSGKHVIAMFTGAILRA
jgi:hypothetical protein